MATLVLYDLSGDINETEFRDADNAPAFKVERVATSPDVVKVSREPDWDHLQPNVVGPTNVFFYFGPQGQLGHLAFGSSPHQPMGNFLKSKSLTNSNPSRYFTSLSGAEYKWKQASRRLECVDKGGQQIAVYEYLMDEPSFAKLTVRPDGWPLLTEIVATLILNRIAIKFDL